MTDSNTYYIIKSADHDQRFGSSYPFNRYPDRERAGKVADKMAARHGVPMTVIKVEVLPNHTKSQTEDGVYFGGCA